jgi:hypothetical protein
MMYPDMRCAFVVGNVERPCFKGLWLVDVERMGSSAGSF